MILEDGTDSFSRNVSKKLPLSAKIPFKMWPIGCPESSVLLRVKKTL